MLFHVKHTHSWEVCPYHDAERAKATFGKAMAGIMESEVELVGPTWTQRPTPPSFS